MTGAANYFKLQQIKAMLVLHSMMEVVFKLGKVFRLI
jgi:hypothetical protein